MERAMTYRAMIFDDDKDIRLVLKDSLDARGYEVFTFSHPGVCPQYDMTQCPCPPHQSCTDFIVSDMNMPISLGLDFVESQIAKGCNCEHIALMSAGWKNQNLAKAKTMGTKVLFKERLFDGLNEWLTETEKNIDPQRRLSDWWLDDYVSPDNNA